MAKLTVASARSWRVYLYLDKFNRNIEIGIFDKNGPQLVGENEL